MKTRKNKTKKNINFNNETQIFRTNYLKIPIKEKKLRKKKNNNNQNIKKKQINKLIIAQ